MKVFIENLDVIFRDNQAGILTVTPDGKVGVGTASPTNILSVQGGVDSSSSFNGITRHGVYQDAANLNSINLDLNNNADTYYLLASIEAGEGGAVLIEGIVGGKTTSNSTVVSCKISTGGGLNTLSWLNGAAGAAVSPVCDVQVWQALSTGFYQVLVRASSGASPQFNLDVKASGTAARVYPLSQANIVAPQGTFVKSLLEDVQLQQNWQGVSTFAKDVVVQGTTNAQALVVAGPATLQDGATVLNGLNIRSGDLHVSSSLNVTQHANLKGGAYVSNGLTVAGPSTVTTLTATDKVYVKDITASQSATVQGGLSVAGASAFGNTVSIANGLNVTGTAVMQNDLRVKGSTLVTGDESVGGSLSIADVLTVGGATNMQDAAIRGNTNVQALTVGGPATFMAATAFGSGTTVTGPGTFDDDVQVKGNASVAKALAVSGPAKFSTDVAIDGNATLMDTIIIGNFAVSGPTSLNGATTIGTGGGADVVIRGGATIAGNTTFQMGATFGGNVAVSGTSTLGGAVVVNNGATVTGVATFNNDVVSKGTVSAATSVVYGLLTVGTPAFGGIVVNGDSTLKNGVTVTGAAALQNALTVAGTATLSGGAAVMNGLSANTVNITGGTTADLTVRGSSVVTGNMTTAGATTLNGGLTVGGTSPANFMSGITVSGTQGTTSLNAGVTVGGGATISGGLTVQNSPLTVNATADGTTGFAVATDRTRVTFGGVDAIVVNSSGVTVANGTLSVNNLAPAANGQPILITGDVNIRGNITATGSVTGSNGSIGTPTTTPTTPTPAGTISAAYSNPSPSGQGVENFYTKVGRTLYARYRFNTSSQSVNSPRAITVNHSIGNVGYIVQAIVTCDGLATNRMFIPYVVNKSANSFVVRVDSITFDPAANTMGYSGSFATGTSGMSVDIVVTEVFA